jgi:hypothetical protein
MAPQLRKINWLDASPSRRTGRRRGHRQLWRDLRHVRAISLNSSPALESILNMTPEVTCGLAVGHPVAASFEDLTGKGLPFLRNNLER